MVEWKGLGSLGAFENIGTDKKIIEGEKLVTLLNYITKGRFFCYLLLWDRALVF